MRRIRNTSLPFFCVALSLFIVVPAAAQVNQVLDSTFVNGREIAAELIFDSPDTQYEYSGITGTNIEACKLSALDGLYCLDAKLIRNWPQPTQSSNSATVVDCEDPVLDLDTKKDNTCTGLTVDLEGNIWIAGKNKGKSHSLIKLVPYDSGCPAAPYEGALELGKLTSYGDYCAYEFATGRPLLIDLAPIGGDMAENFALPGHAAPLKAVIGLEERKTVVAFLESGEVVEIASGKSDWGLIGPEQLLAVTLLQYQDPLKNVILTVTTNGRILAWDLAGTGPAVEVAITGAAQAEPGQCSEDDALYSIRASSTTGLVYLTDSQYCEVVALEPSLDDGDNLSLAYAADLYRSVLSIADLTVPTGVTVAPGTFIDLSNCYDEACTLATDSDGQPAAQMQFVNLGIDSATGLSLFQVEGIPDCRYDPLACTAILDPGFTGGETAAVADLISAGVIVPLYLDQGDNRDVVGNPGAQRLNITPLLPAEVTDLFPEGLPDLLIPRYVRGQFGNNFSINGFFGIPQDGVVFRDTFEITYSLPELGVSSNGCALTYGDIEWDIVGTVSERFVSASDPYSASSPLHLLSVSNADCGSSRARDKTWSFKPYNLEPARCTFNPDLGDNWADDGTCKLGGVDEDPDDAVYAKMLLVLVDDFQQTLEQLACVDADGNGASPLTESDCGTIGNQVVNMIDKVDKCWDATQQPKQSSGDQNCQAFDSQLANLQAQLEQTFPNGTDIANRVGELKARADIIRHVFETRFMPSLLTLPDQAFDEPNP